MLETQVRSLGREDPLEEKMATHLSVLAGKIPWTEDRGRVRHDLAAEHTHTRACTHTHESTGIYTPHFVCPFSHPTKDTCCFHLLPSVNNAAVNTGVQISFQDPAFNSLGYITRNGIAGSYGILFLIF